MREINLGKRPREEHDNVGLSENTKQQRGDDSASTGFASGPAGRHHLCFTGTATIHLNLNIETLSKESEQRHEEQDLELRLGPPPVQRETRDFLAQLGQTPDQILGKQQPEVSQASSSRQQFGWQGQEAFHLAQPHREIGPSSQPEEINEQMPLKISSDSDSESNHARPLFIRETSHARIHHQAGPSNQGEARSLHQAGPSDHLRPRDQAEQGQTTLTEQFKQQRYEIDKQSQVLEKQYQAGSSNLGMHSFPIPLDQIPWHQIIQAQRNIQRGGTGDESSHRQTQGDSALLASCPNRSRDELLIFAQAVINQGHREKLPEHLLQSIRLMPFNHSEYKAIVNIYKAHGIKGRQLGDLRRRIYNMTEMGKKAGEDFRKKVNQLNRPLEAKDSEAKRDPSNSADGSGADETIA